MKPVSALVLLILAVPAAVHARPYTKNVAIVVYENAEPLDWAGPFEVYNDAARFGQVRGEPAFNVFIVSKTTDSVNAQGMTVVPSYSIANAPAPDIVLFPGGPASKVYDDPEFFAWAERVSRAAEIAQSVCTGAFVLGKAGLLDSLTVTTHYGSLERLQQRHPLARVQGGRRFVDNGHVVTTAGISAGIDGSLHVVARLLGRRIADDVARYMEYHWSPEATLAGTYHLLNPSTDDMGRKYQEGDIRFGEKDYEGAATIYRAVLEKEPGDPDTWASLAQALSAVNDHAGAAGAYEHAAPGFKGTAIGFTWYNAATEHARAGQRDEAVTALRKALDAGWKDRGALRTNESFAALREDPRFKEMAAGE